MKETPPVYVLAREMDRGPAIYYMNEHARRRCDGSCISSRLARGGSAVWALRITGSWLVARSSSEMRIVVGFDPGLLEDL
jgi:hypothetical protein